MSDIMDKPENSTAQKAPLAYIESAEGDPESASCPEDCPWKQGISLDVEDNDGRFPKPEGDDGSQADAARRLYRPIRTYWQTRVRALFPGTLGSELKAKLHDVDMIWQQGVVIRGQQQRVDY